MAKHPEGLLTNDNLIAVWLNHNELRWRVVLSTPIFAGTVAFGWYTLLTAGFHLAADAVLVLGVLAMLAYFISITRLNDYAGAYHDYIVGRPTIKKPILRMPAQLMAISLPLIFLLL